MFGANARAAALAMTAATFLGVAGCRTVSDLRTAALTEGAQRNFADDYDEVTRASVAAVKSLDLTIEEVTQVDKNTWHVLATAGVSAFSWGELVRVSVRRQPARDVSVWVLTLRRLAVNVTAKDDYSPEVFRLMDSNLRSRQTSSEASAP